MKLILHTIVWVTCFLLTSAASLHAENKGPKLTVKKTVNIPVLDGKADDWKGIDSVTVKVVPARKKDDRNFSGSVDVQLRSIMNGENIFFLAQWKDSTKNNTHKLLTWDEKEDGYIEGKDREDRFVLRFDMGGDYHNCMLSGTEYRADVWHWKAFRSNTAGLAHDKMHIFSFNQTPKAKKHMALTGKEIWVFRPSDAGDKLYKSQRPIDNIGKTAPRYVVNKKVTGSIADVKAGAVWDNGMWTLELGRKLNTGHGDDIRFEAGKTYRASTAVFDHTGDDHHSTGPFVLVIPKK